MLLVEWVSKLAFMSHKSRHYTTNSKLEMSTSFSRAFERISCLSWALVETINLQNYKVKMLKKCMFLKSKRRNMFYSAHLLYNNQPSGLVFNAKATHLG